MKRLFTTLASLLCLYGCSPNSSTESNEAANSVEKNYQFKAEGNPIVRHLRAADPDCHVWADGKLWMYTSQDHDSDSATMAEVGHGYAKMDGYHVFASMANLLAQHFYLSFFRMDTKLVHV